jgi:hypothetical protein
LALQWSQRVGDSHGGQFVGNLPSGQGASTRSACRFGALAQHPCTDATPMVPAGV